MPGIEPSVITHCLNVYSSSQPVRQKKRVFAPERDNAIKGKVQKLTMLENTCLYHIQNIHNGKINGSTSFVIDNMYYVSF